MKTNPYSNLPEKSFWRKSVATKSVFDLEDLYTKKFNIRARDQIATAGSCFAQHISKRLQSAGYRYLDCEPAPPAFPSEKLADFGYGMYSARFGNVYTARQLLQLAQRAFGEFSPVEQFYEGGGRCYDLLRPSIETNGFSSLEEAKSALTDHLASVRRMIENCSIFIFTFGLTEGWVDRRDGTTYPVCPGTIAGEFDPEKYEFINFSYGEIISDMMAFIKIARRVNPKIKMIFTVSPVPLVATATSEHVLVATTYSKSVLRAVAGSLSAKLTFVDYFPSYEVIVGIPTRSAFFDPDLRSVNRRGVDMVMEHFFAQHPPLVTKPAEQRKFEEEEDIVCEEARLDVKE